MTERDRILRKLKECFMMKKESSYDVAGDRAYKKVLMTA